MRVEYVKGEPISFSANYRDGVGFLGHGRSTSLLMNDDELAHVEAVMLSLLRRGESFLLSWTPPDGRGRRNTMWVHPAAELTFHYDNPERPLLRERWLEQLSRAESFGENRIVVSR